MLNSIFNCIGGAVKWERNVMEQLSTYSDSVALHIVALLDPIVRSSSSSSSISSSSISISSSRKSDNITAAGRRLHFLTQLGIMLQSTNCLQLQAALLSNEAHLKSSIEIDCSPTRADSHRSSSSSSSHEIGLEPTWMFRIDSSGRNAMPLSVFNRESARCDPPCKDAGQG